LGFATLAASIPQQIGLCTDNQSFTAGGDAVQPTTGGLMVWRKADNWTAFTDGNQTWLNGPNGLEIRLNTQRFAWEADAPGHAVTPDKAYPPPVTHNPPITTGPAGSDPSAPAVPAAIDAGELSIKPLTDGEKPLAPLAVAVGQDFVVKTVGNASIGYGWTLLPSDDKLVHLVSQSEDSSRSVLFAGAAQTTTMEFRADAPGHTNVRFQLDARSGLNFVPEVQTLDLTITGN